MAAGGSTRTVLTALFANAGIAVAKFVGFMITRSTSMLTESVHSLADTSNQALLLLGGRQAKKAASLEHPFGYGRERYFWSFVVAMILFSLGGLFAIYEGWEKVQHPHELDAPIVAIVILLLGLGLEGFAFKTAKEEAERVKGASVSWPQFIRRSRNPELPVVLLEDAGALLGLLIAMFGVLGAWFIDPVLDGWATLAIGALLLVIAVVLAIEMKSLLIGESAIPEDRDRLIAAIEGHRDVHSLLHLRTQHLGPDELLVGAKVNFRSSLGMESLSTVINDIEAQMRTAVPIARVIYLEPDLLNSPSATLGTLPPAPTRHDEHVPSEPLSDPLAAPANPVEEPVSSSSQAPLFSGLRRGRPTGGNDPFSMPGDDPSPHVPPAPTPSSIRYSDDESPMFGADAIEDAPAERSGRGQRRETSEGNEGIDGGDEGGDEGVRRNLADVIESDEQPEADSPEATATGATAAGATATAATFSDAAKSAKAEATADRPKKTSETPKATDSAKVSGPDTGAAPAKATDSAKGADAAEAGETPSSPKIERSAKVVESPKADKRDGSGEETKDATGQNGPDAKSSDSKPASPKDSDTGSSGSQPADKKLTDAQSSDKTPPSEKARSDKGGDQKNKGANSKKPSANDNKKSTDRNDTAGSNDTASNDTASNDASKDKNTSKDRETK